METEKNAFLVIVKIERCLMALPQVKKVKEQREKVSETETAACV